MILTTKNELNFFCVKTYPVILTLCCQTHVTYDTVEGLVNNTPNYDKIQTGNNYYTVKGKPCRKSANMYFRIKRLTRINKCYNLNLGL